MQLSYWEKNTYFEKTDVVIIGSGIVGLSAALELKIKKPKLKILIIERGFLPCGASTKNAGFACFGSISELIDDLNKDSLDNVLHLVEKRWKGLLKLRKNLGDKNIDFQNLGGFELFTENNNFELCADKIDFFNYTLKPIIGKNETYRIADEKINYFGFKNTLHLIENCHEGQIDSGKMMYFLTQKVQSLGVNIINGLEVLKLEDAQNQVKLYLSQNISITTKKLLIATNGFAKELMPELDVFPARAQVLITNEINNLTIKGTFHYDKGYYYFRNIGKRLLFGGGRNLDFQAEQTSVMELTKKVQDQLEVLLKTIIIPEKKFEISHRWTGIMGIGETKKTILKPLSKNISCAVRMGGMGIAIGSCIGEEAANLVLTQLSD